VEEAWVEVGNLIAARQAKRYDQAVKLLLDLRDVDGRTGGGDFWPRVEALRSAHAAKTRLVERLEDAGL
jgi:hypothetical protein